MVNLHVRKALESDRDGISDVIVAAFGNVEGNEITELVAGLLADPSAHPLLSLVAAADDSIVGHILFTHARIRQPRQTVPSAILAPLSVHPEHQNQGIGGRLIREGLRRLKAAGVGLVFVLGHPGYYPKHGFAAAGKKGFDAPYPIPPRNSGAWMVQELRPGIVERISGEVICAEALDDPRYWRE